MYARSQQLTLSVPPLSVYAVDPHQTTITRASPDAGRQPQGRQEAQNHQKEETRPERASKVSTCQRVRLQMPVCLFICPSVCLSVCLSVCMSEAVCVPVCVYICV